MKVTVKMPELPHMNNGDRVPFDLYFEITGTDVNVEVSHDDRILEQGVTKTPNIVKTKFTSKKSDKKLPESTRPGLISKITVFLFPEKDA
jgi:CO dehydrogenase/acetyl-CoA synthase beta subunit